MTRSNLIRTNLFPYHITTRTINKDWFDIALVEVWKISLYCLKHANEKHPAQIISFVLMNNHYHLLIKTPNSDIDLFMYEFNKNLANIVLKKSKRTSRIFGGRYKWCLIRSQTYLYNCYRYIYQNPVRAGIETRCENYPYSTLFYLTHNKTFPLQLGDLFGFKDEYALTWLNQKIDKDEVDAIKKALSRSTLDRLVCHKTKKVIKRIS